MGQDEAVLLDRAAFADLAISTRASCRSRIGMWHVAPIANPPARGARAR